MFSKSRNRKRAAGNPASIVRRGCGDISTQIGEFIGASFPNHLMLNPGDQLRDVNPWIVRQCNLLGFLPGKQSR
jgi:hypothetical protein